MLHRTGSSVLESVHGPFLDFRKRIASQSGTDNNLMQFFSGLLQAMCRVYDISDDPKNYVLAQVRALHGDKVNINGDCAPTAELVQFRPNLGTLVYKSFVGKPHLSEHDDTDVRTSFGIIVDAYFNPTEPEKPVRTLIAVDRKKYPDYADGLLSGNQYGYSMGCTAQYCVCNTCGNIATVDEEWCDHMRYHKGKHVGGILQWESMHAVEYAELSKVIGPADKGALGEKVLGGFAASASAQKARTLLRQYFAENADKWRRG
jgi:hypothetical protein